MHIHKCFFIESPLFFFIDNGRHRHDGASRFSLLFKKIGGRRAADCGAREGYGKTVCTYPQAPRCILPPKPCAQVENAVLCENWQVEDEDEDEN